VGRGKPQWTGEEGKNGARRTAQTRILGGEKKAADTFAPKMAGAGARKGNKAKLGKDGTVRSGKLAQRGKRSPTTTTEIVHKGATGKETDCALPGGGTRRGKKKKKNPPSEASVLVGGEE